MTKIRVLIAEDEPALRDALADLIRSEDDLDLVGAAPDAAHAIELARSLRPDVALVDVKMPAGGGQRAAREIRVNSPSTRVIALSAYEDRSTVLEMLRAGAVGYLVKGSEVDEILQTIHRAHRGQGALSAQITTGVIDELTGQLDRQQQEVESRQQQIERVRRAFAAEAIRILFQPIVDLSTREVIGAEALSRFEIEPAQTPDVWFREAAGVGMGIDLELAAIRSALTYLDRLPPATYLSVNLSPDTATSARFLHTLGSTPAERIVLEVTEHAAVEDYDALERALAGLRKEGVRLAIDDAGSGFASLRHILRLSPEIIKLDITLTRNIDSDRARHALASALTSFASEIGAGIVAEGIETEAEVQALRALGVRHGQGYYLARPAPLDELKLSASG